MKQQDMGGQAFPVTEDNYAPKWAETGMTLRDYFAAKAMVSLIPMPHNELQEFTSEYDECTTLYLLGLAAYKCADALLVARG